MTDRRRILSCTAFRRLQFKAQVFADQRHDHFRTRLSHTLEVADVARRIASMLHVNERLSECIALAHDLGHPPFGHAGERALAEAMVGHGGFEHNARTLRVVDYLEHPFPPCRGLNLTYEVREGLVTHTTRYDRPQDESSSTGGAPFSFRGRQPSVESQIASVADRIAYDSHDLEDAFGARVLDEASLQEVSLWRNVADPWRHAHPSAALAALRRPILDDLIGLMISDAVGEAGRRVDRSRPATVDDICNAESPVVAFSNSFQDAVVELETLLVNRVYRHPEIVKADKEAEAMVRGLFDAYLADPTRLPARFADRVPEQGRHRVICDYIAGMTDRFCRHALADIE